MYICIPYISDAFVVTSQPRGAGLSGSVAQTWVPASLETFRWSSSKSLRLMRTLDSPWLGGVGNQFLWEKNGIKPLGIYYWVFLVMILHHLFQHHYRNGKMVGT